METGPDSAVDQRSIGKLLKALGFSHVSARARHPEQDGGEIAAFKNDVARTLDAYVGRVARRQPVEIWFQNGARIGQKTGLVRQWAKARHAADPARRPTLRAPFCLVLSARRGVGAGLALPFTDTEAMRLHIDEITLHVAEGAHAVLLLDSAGCHTTGALVWPRNITPILLPPRSPELNPVDQVWQFLRANFLSNQFFETHHEIIEASCEVSNRLTALTQTIRSIGM